MSGTSDKTSKGKYYVLFVDDEEKTRKAFQRLFGEEFKILLAGDGVEGFQVFQERADEIGVIVTDQKMPKETGVQFLGKVAEQNEDIVRILSTAYAELDAAVEGVNRGGIYRYVTKPWDVPELEITIRRAMELFELRRAQSSFAVSQDLDVSQLIEAEQVASLAAAKLVTGESASKRAMPAASAFLSILGREELGAETGVSWPEVYQNLVGFFESASGAASEAVQAQTAPEWARTTPPSMAVQAAAVGCEGFELEFSGADSSIWPGPAPLLAEVLRPLMLALSELASRLPDGKCRVKGNFNTVDFLFSGFPLKKAFVSLLADAEGDTLLNSLLQAVIQVYAHDGKISAIEDGDGLAIRLGFEEGATDSDPFLEVVQGISGDRS